MKAKVAGAARTATRGYARIGGSDRRLTRAVGLSGGQVRTLAVFALPLTVSVTPVVVGSGTGTTPQMVTTGAATATPSGGLAPYTYAWTAGNTPSLASTTFSAFVPSNYTAQQPYTVTVTDAIGNTAQASGQASFVNIGFGVFPGG